MISFVRCTSVHQSGLPSQSDHTVPLQSSLNLSLLHGGHFFGVRVVEENSNGLIEI